MAALAPYRIPRGLRDHTLVDSVSRHFDAGPCHHHGKYRKDDQSAKGIHDFLEEKHLLNVDRRGRYQPRQFVTKVRVTA